MVRASHAPLPLHAPNKAVSANVTALDGVQRSWEVRNATTALREAAERLELAGRDDLAREVRSIIGRLG